LSNQNTPAVMNRVIGRWLKAPEGLAANVDCGSCSRADLEPERAVRWRAYKCCAFQPFVANFYCGAMLEVGLSPMPDKIQATAQPIGVLPTQAFRELCAATPDEERGANHLCTFYDPDLRRCGIWQFRPGECSLYYCTNDRNKATREEWSLRAFQLESSVAQMALVHIGFSASEVAAQVQELNSPTLMSHHTRALEIYRACWDWVKTQSEQEILAFVEPHG
jgi:Fe-S-cluster containining protein